MRIDAHQHYWQIGRHGHSWPPPDLPAIHRDFLPVDLAPVRAALGIERTVLIQSQASDADTDWLLTLAAAEPSLGALVGWADLTAAGAPARIAALAQQPKLRGLRPMLQDLPDAWILQPERAPGLAAMVAHDLVFDALIRPSHLAAIRHLALAYPTLRIVVDHAAKPDIAGGGFERWATGIAALADLPNVVCKLSGLVTEAAPGWREADLAAYVAHLLACFGPGRLLWGSDWPVVLLAADYARWHDAAAALTAHLPNAARAAIFGGNAQAVYRID